MIAAAAGAVLLALLVAVELGQVPVRLPFPPGVEYDYMAEPPPGTLPLTWDTGFRVEDDSLPNNTKYILQDQIAGVETVALGPEGWLGLVDKHGQIFMAEPDNQGGYAVTPHPLPWASPGRSLGAKFDANGDLLIANAPLGLLQLASPGDAQSQRLLLLTGRVSDESPLSAGYPIEFANSLDVAADGTVYFTSSTDVVPYRTASGYWETSDSVFVSLAKAQPSGMLLAYHPDNRSTIALMNDLWFANGVALAHDESFVLAADSVQMKIRRYWLHGPKAGSSDVFYDKLPGPPDGISRSTDGQTYWITIYCGAEKLLAYSHIRLVRVLFSWMPRIMRLLGQDFPNIGILLRVNNIGEIVEVLGDKQGAVVSRVTSAFESEDGRLFLGSLHKRGVPVVDLKGARAAKST